jgi:hypothetical protein
LPVAADTVQAHREYECHLETGTARQILSFASSGGFCAVRHRTWDDPTRCVSRYAEWLDKFAFQAGSNDTAQQYLLVRTRFQSTFSPWPVFRRPLSLTR